MKYPKQEIKIRQRTTTTKLAISIASSILIVGSLLSFSSCMDENKSTVANEDGPASAGIASGTINGSLSPSTSPKTPPSCGNTIRRAIKNKMTPPPMRRETSDNCMAERKCLPKNINNINKIKAIAHSRTTTRQRLSGATCESALTKIGMLPNGSVTSISKTKA